ncbi:hypothetical protein [Ideonella sp. A 288]|uniref:hypothetical protein n=1 Tax=Ideonella sp. A 288 TaxID=1962181 RepID=UPI00118677E4|nr:hypothetical protein [Ideonella sp. A 288]
MARLAGRAAAFDERTAGRDSSSTNRTDAFQVNVGEVAYGSFQGIDGNLSDHKDMYQLRLPGPGDYQITVSQDVANQPDPGVPWLLSDRYARVDVTNSTGIFDAGINWTAAWGGADGTLSFSYKGRATTNEYFLAISGGGSYAVSLSRLSTPPSGFNYFGTPGDDLFNGSPGDDDMIGNTGDDWLHGGLGNDDLNGTGGDDWVDYADSPGPVVVVLGPSVKPEFRQLDFGWAYGASGTDAIKEIEHITASAYDDELTGNYQDNRIYGGSGADQIDGAYGDDTFVGGAGDDRLLGGPDLDVARYGGPRSDYDLSVTRDLFITWRVTDRLLLDGVDTLDRVERIEFGDIGVALDVGGGRAGQVAQILRALFGPSSLANEAFVAIGLDLLDAGSSYADAVALAVGTPAFASLAGSHSNLDFVKFVYRNVVGTAPSAKELADYTGLLDAGSFTQASLGLLACQLPLNVNSPDLLGLATTGLEFALPAPG